MARTPLVWIWLLVCAGLGCASNTAAPEGKETSARPPVADPAPAAEAAGGSDVDAAIREEQARRLLSARFRDAGLRIAYDVPVTVGVVTLTVDGFDAQARVGYEYIDRREVDAELSPGQREALGDTDAEILVIEATTKDEVLRAADQFLAALHSAN